MATRRFFGDAEHQTAEVVATTFFGFIDVEDCTDPHPALRGKGLQDHYIRQAMGELRNGVICGCPVLSVELEDFQAANSVEIPHLDHSVLCKDRGGCPENGTPATRFFGLNVVVLGTLGAAFGTGAYLLADGKVIAHLSGASYNRLGTVELEPMEVM